MRASSIWLSLIAAATTFAAASRVEASGCPIPGFTDAAFANSSFSASGTIDSWDDVTGAYGGTNKCTDGTTCSDTNSCGANVGTNSSSASFPTTSGTCTTSAGVSLPIPVAPTIAVANQLGAISGSKTVTGPGNFSATSIDESGNSSVDFKTASPNGAVVIYVSGSITFSGNGALNNDSLKPTNVLIMCTGPSGQSVTLNGNGNAYFTLYCPQADITVDGGGSGGQIWGSIVGNKITGHGSHAVDIHYDKEDANMTSDGISCAGTEASRSAPTLATITSASCTAGTSCPALVQGTINTAAATQTAFTTHATLAGWTFPYITGHLRAREADGTSAISTTASNFSSGTKLFDAADSTDIPVRNDSCAFTATTGLNGSCRYIFTNTNTTATNGAYVFTRTTPGGQTNVLAWNDANAATIGPIIAPNAAYGGAMVATDYTSISHTVLGTTSSPNTAKFGGIDRSTAAVIQASTFTTSPSRPTMVYAGGTDGMLHAVCAQSGGKTVSQTTSVCPAAGTELWAFMPRQQLPLLPSNNQRIDGSVHVIDAFGDFSTTNASGAKGWHTILVFQTGFSKAATSPAVASYPAAYALDVTDPAAPVLLWEYTSHATVATSDFGTGLSSSVGTVLVGGQQKYLAVLETNDGGTSASTAPGAIVTAIYLDTGIQAWQTTKAYSPVTTVPYQAVPGGAVGVDLTGNGFFTDYVFGDLLGRLWRVAAATGVDQTGSATTPLFKFTYTAATVIRPIGSPPAIYSDGTIQYAAFASGGYADQADKNTNWSAGTQYLATVKVKASSPTVLDSASPCNSSSCDLRILTAIDTGTKAYSQPLVVGTKLFQTSDSTDVNTLGYGTVGTATGHVLAMNGINGSASGSAYDSTVAYSGASSLVSGSVGGTTVIYSGGADKQVKLGTAATTSSGTGIGAASGTLGAGTSIAVGGTMKVTRNLWLRTQ
jgi:hypothetical protein